MREKQEGHQMATDVHSAQAWLAMANQARSLRDCGAPTSEVARVAGQAAGMRYRATAERPTVDGFRHAVKCATWRCEADGIIPSLHD